MFIVDKLASGRMPDMVNYLTIPMDECAVGKVLSYDASANDLTKVIGDAASPSTTNLVFGICTAAPNQTLGAGGGVNFPLATTTTSAVKPAVMRVYKDTLIRADVTGTVVIANVEPGTKMAIDTNAVGLVVGTNNNDFVVEKVISDDGTNVKKVAGYFLATQLGA